jgi:hypothetical protein
MVKPEPRRSRRLANLEPEIYVQPVPEVVPEVVVVKSWWSYIFHWG